MNAERAARFRARHEHVQLQRGAEESLAVGQRRRFGRGEELFAEGDSALFFYKVLRGTIRNSTLLDDTRRQIDSFVVAEEIFGFEAAEQHTFTAEAVEDTVVIAFRQSYFRALLHEAPALADALMRAVLGSLRMARNHILLLARRDPKERMAVFLLDLAGRLNADRFTLPMQRTDIADHLGMTRETVSRTLTRLSRDRLIRLDAVDQVLLLDKDSLRRLIHA